MLTQDTLKQFIRYEPETGLFFRIKGQGRSKKGLLSKKIYNRYIHVVLNKKSYLAHRLAFLYMNGDFPLDNLLVDHIDCDASNNKWSNLRLVSPTGNCQNRKGPQKNNSLGVLGVYKVRSGKFMARIKAPNGMRNLGTFLNIEDATLARKIAESKFFIP